MQKKQTLRVISGIYKGRSLKMAPLETTRASKAILKESLFNTLSTEVLGVNFVEFFAGSGSIGIEALSRGAKFAVFFEKNKESHKILEWNLTNICKGSKFKTILGDTFVHYKNALKDLEFPAIAYIDPPFDIRENMQDIYEKCFLMLEHLDTKIFKIIILEHSSTLNVPKNIGDFSHIKAKKFGKSTLSYFVQN